MGYQVYWYNGRWQGYGVPAYCDFKGCKKEIDRGLGYKHEQDDGEPPEIFCCEDHQTIEIDNFIIEAKEHPEWIKHISTDHSWKKWREENPEEFERLKTLLQEND